MILPSRRNISIQIPFSIASSGFISILVSFLCKEARLGNISVAFLRREVAV